MLISPITPGEQRLRNLLTAFHTGVDDVLPLFDEQAVIEYLVETVTFHPHKNLL